MGQCGAFLQFLVDMVQSGRGRGALPPWTPFPPPPSAQATLWGGGVLVMGDGDGRPQRVPCETTKSRPPPALPLHIRGQLSAYLGRVLGYPRPQEQHRGIWPTGRALYILYPMTQLESGMVATWRSGGGEGDEQQWGV